MPLSLDKPASVKSVLAEFSARRRKRVFVCLGLCAAALVAGFSISSTAVALSIMVAMVILIVMFIGVDRGLSGELTEKLIPVLAQ